MTDARLDKVGALFEQAQDMPSEEQTAFLQKHCDEEALRQEITALLSVHEKASGLLENLADTVVPHALDEMQQTEAWREAESDPLGLEGKKVGHYQVEEHLGGGGMGVVYRARDTRLGRTVALKFLPPHLSTSAEAEERFVREARSAAALDHPNIATIHEIGETEQRRRFIAMAYYEGETLKKKISRGPLPVEKALGYATQIAEGLARAHAAGIIHRDVKPANVMVTEHDQGKLLDFGLARAADQSVLTRPGTRVGTAAYMSPEQAEGEAVDHRTDLWALGVVLYEMITGKRPFRGARDASVVYAILHEEPVPVSERRGEIPPALGRIVGRCLQKDPEERYATAQDLLDDLRAVRSGGDAAAIGARPARRRGTRFSRPQWIASVAAVVLMALGAAVGWAFWPDGTVQDGASTSSSPPSVAVLPFEARGPEDSRFIAEGLHDNLLTRLSTISDLKVISQTSVERYRDTSLSLPVIAESLGVRWVVEGGIQTAGNQIQVHAQLIDPRTDAHVWAEDYRRELGTENLFAIQGEITREIAGALQAELTAGESRRVQRRPTEDLTAYRLYVQGRGALKQRTDSTLQRSADLFRRAIARDSSFALAWAGLADARTFLVGYGGVPRDSMLPAADDAARRALALNPDLGEARTSLGRIHFYRMKLPAALRELERAIELRPSYAVAHETRSMVKLTQGRPAEALESARQAVDLDPLAPENRIALAIVLQCRGEVERALQQARRAKGIQPEYGAGIERYFLAMAGRTEEALSMSDTEKDPQGLPAYYRTMAGDTTAARNLLTDFEVESRLVTGLAHAALGEYEAAIESFRQALRHPFHPKQPSPDALTFWFRYRCPTVLDPLRETAAFQAFLREVNRAWGLNPDGSLPVEDIGSATGLFLPVR